MNIVQAKQTLRQLFLDALLAEGITLDVQYENRNLIDTGSQVEPYLIFEIELTGKQQVSIGRPYHTRYFGEMSVGVCCKENEGTSFQDQVADKLVKHLELKDINGVRLKVADVRPAKLMKGWYCLPIVTKFWFDKLAN